MIFLYSQTYTTIFSSYIPSTGRPFPDILLEQGSGRLIGTVRGNTPFRVFHQLIEEFYELFGCFGFW